MYVCYKHIERERTYAINVYVWKLIKETSTELELGRPGGGGGELSVLSHIISYSKQGETYACTSDRKYNLFTAKGFSPYLATAHA